MGFRAPNARELISGFADHMLAHDLGGNHYADPQLALRDNPAEILPQELEALRAMMVAQLNDGDSFQRWFGEFISQSRHELDIAPPEPPYQAGEVYELLQAGEVLERLGGIRVLRIAERCYINGEPLDCENAVALDTLARHTCLNAAALGCALDDPAFLTALTGLINSGYWFFQD